MLPLLLVASTLIADCFAGEVGSLAYESKQNFHYYRDGNKNGDRIVIIRAGQGHDFSLGIDYFRCQQYGGRRLFHSSSQTSVEYQNIVKVYYDNFLLETVEVPRIDSCDCTVSDIDMKILTSFRPVVPEQVTDTPSQIRVYYSFTDGRCVLGIYCFVNSNGKHYVRGYPYERVNTDNCVWR